MRRRESTVHISLSGNGSVGLQPPNLLLTGFEPFDRDPLNPSWELARRLDGHRIDGCRVISACLPVTFDDSLQRLDELLRAHRPHWVVCTGLAGNRSAMGFERVALNLADARIPDNAGQQPRDRSVVSGGPTAYLSRLPVKTMAAAAQARGAPAEVSHSAGTFVCNHVFYGLMWRLARRPALKGVQGGFVHIPWPADLAPRTTTVRSDAPLGTLVEAMAAALSAAVRSADDARLVGGSLS